MTESSLRVKGGCRSQFFSGSKIHQGHYQSSSSNIDCKPFGRTLRTPVRQWARPVKISIPKPIAVVGLFDADAGFQNCGRDSLTFQNPCVQGIITYQPDVKIFPNDETTGKSISVCDFVLSERIMLSFLWMGLSRNYNFALPANSLPATGRFSEFSRSILRPPGQSRLAESPSRTPPPRPISSDQPGVPPRHVVAPVVPMEGGIPVDHEPSAERGPLLDDVIAIHFCPCCKSRLTSTRKNTTRGS